MGAPVRSSESSVPQTCTVELWMRKVAGPVMCVPSVTVNTKVSPSIARILFWAWGSKRKVIRPESSSAGVNATLGASTSLPAMNSAPLAGPWLILNVRSPGPLSRSVARRWPSRDSVASSSTRRVVLISMTGGWFRGIH